MPPTLLTCSCGATTSVPDDQDHAGTQTLLTVERLHHELGHTTRRTPNHTPSHSPSHDNPSNDHPPQPRLNGRFARKAPQADN